MSRDDERWVRDRLAAAVQSVPPPVDLAARAERRAGWIRRRRYGTAVAVAAAVAAVPLALGGVGEGDRSLPPARSGDPVCERSDRALPEQPEAVSAADVTWPYRGDPALRPALDRVMRGSIESGAGRPRPLYAQRLPEPAGSAVFVFAGELPAGGPWLVVARVLPADPRGDLSIPPDSATAMARLPRLAPDAHVSLLVPVPGGGSPVPGTGWDRYGNLLVAVAAPGADSVVYQACYRGRAFTVDGPGDALVRAVGPVDAPGRVTVRDGGTVTASGAVGDPVFGQPVAVLPAVEPVPVPDGTREVQRLRGQGQPAAEQTVAATVPAAKLVGRCRGPAPLEVLVDRDRVLGRILCDEQVHVVAEGVALAQGQPLSTQAAPELPGVAGPPVSYEVVVATAG